jgi:hypothetical protein
VSAPRLRAWLLCSAPRLFARVCAPTDRELGLLGEELVARALRARGARVLERRLRTPWGELDLLARDAGGLVCVEVKAGRRVPLPRPRGAAPRPLPADDRPGARVDARGEARLAAIARGVAARAGAPARCEVWEVVLDRRGAVTLAAREPGRSFPPLARP